MEAELDPGLPFGPELPQQEPKYRRGSNSWISIDKGGGFSTGPGNTSIASRLV